MNPAYCLKVLLGEILQAISLFHYRWHARSMFLDYNLRACIILYFLSRYECSLLIGRVSSVLLTNDAERENLNPHSGTSCMAWGSNPRPFCLCSYPWRVHRPGWVDCSNTSCVTFCLQAAVLARTIEDCQGQMSEAQVSGGHSSIWWL